MLAQPFVDFFEKLLSPLVEIRSEFVYCAGIDTIVHRKSFKPSRVRAAGNVVAQRVAVIVEVVAEKAQAAGVHFDGHVIAPSCHKTTFFIFFDRAGLQELAQQRLLGCVAAVLLK